MYLRGGMGSAAAWLMAFLRGPLGWSKLERIRADSSRSNPYLYGTCIHFRFFYFLYLAGPSGEHLLRCVGPIPPAGVLLDSSSPVSEGALRLSEVG